MVTFDKDDYEVNPPRKEFMVSINYTHTDDGRQGAINRATEAIDKVFMSKEENSVFTIVYDDSNFLTTSFVLETGMIEADRLMRKRDAIKEDMEESIHVDEVEYVMARVGDVREVARRS